MEFHGFPFLFLGKWDEAAQANWQAQFDYQAAQSASGNGRSPGSSRSPFSSSREADLPPGPPGWTTTSRPPTGGAGDAAGFEQYVLEKGDREQFEEYRLILGEDAPESFAEFLDLKYNHPEKWDAPGTMKQQTVFVNNAPCATTPEKYTGYFLKMGAKHAVQFFNVGYTQDNPLQLRYDMARQFDLSKAVDIEILEDGAVKFNIYMELGVAEKRMFRTGWRIDKPGDKPRIIMGFRRLRDD